MIEWILSLRSKTKLLMMATWDVSALILALLFAYWVRLGVSDWHFTALDWATLFANVIFCISVLVLLGHYHQVIRYINIKAIFIIVMALTASVGYLLSAKFLLGMFMPLSVPILYFAISVFALAVPRLLIQASFQMQSYRLGDKCLIYGASDTGRLLASSLLTGTELVPVAFVDDKKIYQGKQILGLPVIQRDSIPEFAKKFAVKKMLLAVNNSSSQRRQELIKELEPYAIELLSVPNLSDILSGKRRIDELTEINIEELLGRDPVPPLQALLSVNITGKTVMVTGAGGSIGSELCRQIIKQAPDTLILYELSEFNLYQIETELARVKARENDKCCSPTKIVPVLASIQDSDVLRHIFTTYKIHTIYHAAAYKHVPMIENNVSAGVKNNIFGTANVALTAMEFEVEKFVLVSTDKAVRPTNIMGATKRFAELFIQGIADLGAKTEFAIVRFGNVLGSSGSVVPLFTRQIKAGGPITVTHPDITRFFMTIPEAAALVIQAGAMGKTGEVYVLDMGESVKIVDLATKMAHLMGHEVNSPHSPNNINIHFTGLRPGEKLYEELLISDAKAYTEHPRIMGAEEIKLDFEDVVMLIDKLNVALNNKNENAVKQILIDAPLAYSAPNDALYALSDTPKAS
ncbi:polysaccharide biosynthesis protein [Aestuariibacter sp. AA17]|uniref:Polysaccharide biosynthesis protein n=1 Tax=Fluctibacter corallii TaxID=2984329 RepID=A0ABT3ADN3_9ALTE|nr:nucleoside-diphosphate sugar epimerase/dehydratase [Aestuariibacter sp. AA17]MCV2886682.1 polysaccharide biosynthesis protein [Aestuariibacter sp. AA17]